MKSKRVFHVCSADNSDIDNVINSKEYATVSGKPDSDTDYIAISSKNERVLLCRLDRVVRYESGVSKVWTTGKNPKGTNWKSLYMFTDVIELSNASMDKISDINKIMVKSNGVKQPRNFQPTGAYFNIYL
jgi:hypothetical protein